MGKARSADTYPLGEGNMKWTCTEWLEKNIDGDFVLLDCQPNIHDYIKEHIPGAVYFNPALLRVPKNGVPGNYIPEDAVEDLFERVGIDEDYPTIVYTGTGPFKGWGDGLEQTMIAYSLLRFGAEEVWLLDGGIDTWKHEGREMSQEYPECPESSFDADVQEDFYISTDEVKQVKDQDDVMLLDARPPEMYEGQSVWPKPGHIPGAINFPWKSLFHEDNTRLLKSDDEIQALIDEHGVTKDHHVICSCGTGREATAEFLIFKYLLDFPHVKNYEGSFTEWCHLDLPTVTGSNPD